MTTLGYEIRGKDGFYVRRQISSNTLPFHFKRTLSSVLNLV